MDTANTAERLAAKLTRVMNQVVGDRGKVIYVVTEGLGTGWIVVFDTEHAALKAYHAYRYAKGVRFGESKKVNGWFIAVDPTV